MSHHTTIHSASQIRLDLFELKEKVEETSRALKVSSVDPRAIHAIQDQQRERAVLLDGIARYALEHYARDFRVVDIDIEARGEHKEVVHTYATYFHPIIERIRQKMTKVEERLRALSPPVRADRPTEAAAVERTSSVEAEDERPSVSTAFLTVKTIGLLLRAGAEKEALDLFKTLDPRMQDTIFGKLWEVKGKPVSDHRDPSLRAIAHPQFGKVSFLGTEARCRSAAQEKALAVELCLTPDLLLSSMEECCKTGDMGQLRQLFDLLPPKLRGSLCGKMWEVMGRPRGLHSDYGRVSFLELEGFSAGNDKREEAINRLKPEAIALRDQVQTEMRGLQRENEQIDQGRYQGRSLSRGQEKYDAKKDALHHYIEKMVGLLDHRGFQRENLDPRCLTSHLASMYVQKYPFIAPQVLMFSPTANEAYLVPSDEFVSGKAPEIDLGDIGAQKDYRVRVMQDTLATLQKGFYRAPSGSVVPVDGISGAKTACLFKSAGERALRPGRYETQITVIERDCLEVAERMAARSGTQPLILNMACDDHFGGGYLTGARAQEEDVTRRSALAYALDARYGEQATNFYPLHRAGVAAGVYVADVPVFRAGYEKGYQYLDKPFMAAFATVAAFKNPRLEDRSGELRLNSRAEKETREKIRTILEMAYRKGHTSLVLSALGAGAFANPPKHIAELFRSVIEEEYPNCFEEIAFAIIDDHNAHKAHNPRGNFLPFVETFLSMPGAAAYDRTGQPITA